MLRNVSVLRASLALLVPAAASLPVLALPPSTARAAVFDAGVDDPSGRGGIAAAAADTEKAGTPRIIEFEADQLAYDDGRDVVTASGSVMVTRNGYRLNADRVIWNRASGTINAEGHVRLSDAKGNETLVDKVELTDDLRDGAIENLLLILEDGSRLAARNGRKLGTLTAIERAVYSPCKVCTSTGEERPLWRLKAVKVVRDETRRRIRYHGAYFEFMGVPIAYTPYISHPEPGVNKDTGLLVPRLKQSRSIGFSVELPYFIDLSPSQDLLLAPVFYTEELPILGMEYRLFSGLGPITVGGSLTVADREIAANPTVGSPSLTLRDQVRGHLYLRGRFDHSPRWRSTFDSRWTTDDTYMRRYDISDDDRLRSLYRVERFGQRDYLQIDTRAFQGLRDGDSIGRAPLVLPGIDYRWTSAPGWRNSRFNLRANLLSIMRTDGRDLNGDLLSRDLQRASVSAGWELPHINRLGQIWTATGSIRGDFYNSHGIDTGNPLVDRNGSFGRFLPQVALDMRWPFKSGILGGVQTLTPILLVVASGRVGNRLVPVEDSLSYDLDDLNLFDLNRFPGLDGWEKGVRVAYGGEWTWSIRRIRVSARFGQSYRFERAPGTFFAGTGLTGRTSDFVGRTSIAVGNRFELLHRYRIDKSSLAIRRNEIDATIRGRVFELGAGYTKLNRDIAALALEDREEARLRGRLQITRTWSLRGSTILDLTRKLEPIRHKIGAFYEDECFRFGLTYRRNFTSDRDFKRGTTVQFEFALKNLGG